MIPAKINPAATLRGSDCEATGTSEGYVQRAEKYMNGVEAADEAAPGAREEILNGKIKAADREICAIAKAPKEQRPEIVAELRKPKSERDKQLASSTKKPFREGRIF